MKNPFPGLFRAGTSPPGSISPGRRLPPRPAFATARAFRQVRHPTSAIQVSAVYACVRVIAETVASLPLHVYEATDAGSRRPASTSSTACCTTSRIPRPTSFVWREVMLSHLLLWKQLLPDPPFRPQRHHGAVSAFARPHGRGPGTARQADHLRPPTESSRTSRRTCCTSPASALTASWGTAPIALEKRPSTTASRQRSTAAGSLPTARGPRASLRIPIR